MANMSRGDTQATAAMMRRWARHWLRSCREMPARALAVLDRDGDPERQVHEFRRLMKAWRALLRLAPAELDENARQVRAGAAHLRRSFGIARDTAVVAKVLGTLSPDLVGADDGRAAAGTLLREQGEAVRAELRRLSGEMACWSLSDETGGFLARAFRQGYRRARRYGRRDPRRMAPERLHDWRTTIVDLGYQLGFFQSADPARFRRQAKMAECLRARLGNAIDLDMARRYLAAAPSTDESERLSDEIARRIARRRSQAARLADRLLDRRPRRACADLREAMAHRPPRRISFA